MSFKSREAVCGSELVPSHQLSRMFTVQCGDASVSLVCLTSMGMWLCAG